MTNPPCIGEHESNHNLCDGDPQGATYMERRPCAKRDECVGLLLYGAKTGHKISAIRQSLTPARLDVLCARMIEEFAIFDGVPGTDEGKELIVTGNDATSSVLAPPTVQLAKTKRRRRWKKRVFRELSPEMHALHDHFIDVLRQVFPTRTFVWGTQVVVTPGVFYYVDHRDEHHISWYCKSIFGHDFPIASINFMTRTKTITVRLPVTVAEISAHVTKATRQRLDLVPFYKPQSRWRSAAQLLNREGLGTCAEVLRVLYDRNILQLGG